MQEKIDIEILTLVLDIQDFRSYSPQGESWGGYPIKADGNVIEVNYDLIAIDGKEYLL